ncbi:G-protein coupled receptors family 1 profile domain-containing protein [Caenorhabditis elegans]|uniref:G-protein coupled receptors family 1 profile domain-containing protein n=1 Tax=Caenorhabditis elegans TaxID=6239 RepID=Q9TYR5_CAEEL|nr:G-protein coupled receptors family 1 profile domain-containing protein [Caenorhabditis elegans]CCD63381.1 G-protein coupled receptors family 1 profile domain-containing protein [Caenorhabditis elegans]|eukprot:NP_500880.1 Serpentine Receptor, class V [Caenorhabditis elegans]
MSSNETEVIEQNNSLIGKFYWNYLIYYFLCIAILPVYILIVACILKSRKHSAMFQTTFYTILIQHCIADILALPFYATLRLSYTLWPHVFYDLKDFGIAAISFNGMYWFIIIRCYGITLMTVQRYFIIGRPTDRSTLFMQSLKPWKVVLIYWFPPVIFCVIFYSHMDITYDSPEQMKYVTDPDVIEGSSRTAFFYVLFSCLICLICYGFILKIVRSKSQTASVSIQREVRLAFQVLLSFLAKLVMMIYFLLIFITSLCSAGTIRDMVFVVAVRRNFPTAYGTLSFIGPFTILIFNNDVYRNVRRMIFRNKISKFTVT